MYIDLTKCCNCITNFTETRPIIDQYQVTTDKCSRIVNDPNREDDPEYIVRLIGQIVTVSLETVKIVNSLPEIEV